MKKLLKQFIIFVIVATLLGMTNISKAAIATISLNPDKTEYEQSDTVTITVELNNISSNMINLYGKLRYNNTQLTLNKMTPNSLEGWSGSTLLKNSNFDIGVDDTSKLGGKSKAITLEFSIVEGFVGNAEVTIESELVDSNRNEENPTAKTTIKVVEKKTGTGDDTPGGNQDEDPGNDNPDENQGNQGDSSNTTVDNVVSIQGGKDNTITGTKIDASSDIYKEMKEELLADGYNDVFCAYELKVTGKTEDGIILTFDVGTKNNGKEAMVLHKKDNGKYEKFKATVKNGKVEITVKEFSPFMLALKDSNNNGNTNNNNKSDTLPSGNLPQTGEGTLEKVFIFGGSLTIAVAIFFFVEMKLLRK